jgi:transposase-like protein
MLQRGGEVVIRMLANVKQVTIGPLIGRTIAKGTLIYTDEYDIYSRLVEWGYDHETVCHAAGEYARDDDGDGFCEVHVNTLEGFWSLLRSWLRPHRGIPQEIRLAIVQGMLNLRPYRARERLRRSRCSRGAGPWASPPATSAAPDIEDAVEDLAEVDLTRAPAGLGIGQEWLEPLPLGPGQI